MRSGSVKCNEMGWTSVYFALQTIHRHTYIHTCTPVSVQIGTPSNLPGGLISTPEEV